jgi:uncharacterized protein YbaA (DUF1428 family)
LAPYVDGFLLPIPRKNVEAYRRIARIAGKVWREHGALEYRECIADDLARGRASFSRRVAAGRGETVAFSWIVYRSKAHRDKVNARVMRDPRIAAMMDEMRDPRRTPFDVRRMSYGGFRVLVEA